MSRPSHRGRIPAILLCVLAIGCTKNTSVDVGDGEGSCFAGELRCNPDTFIFEQCRNDGDAFETFEGAVPCASLALCEQGVQLAPPACPAPACSAGLSQCVNGAALTCDADQNAFVPVDDCGGVNRQCNPRTGQCLDLYIDPYEVARSAYSDFLASGTADLPPGCSHKTSHVPDDWDAQLAHPDLPVTGVDWCDAFAYCAWNGQHLCGLIDGGMLLYDTFADPGLSEWQNACTSGGELAYPYGDQYQSQSCNDAGKDKSAAVDELFAGDAKQVELCRSPRGSYGATVNLLGNVAEWENACSRDATILQAGAGPADSCRVRGGHAQTPMADMAMGCNVQPADPIRRETRSPMIGFRCCGPR